MINLYTVDTNILIYSVDRTGDARGQQAALLIRQIAMRDSICTLQSLGEFFHATTRKKLLRIDDAARALSAWNQVFRVVAADFEAMSRATELTRSRSLSFWDAMLIATAQSAGCTVLFSEDMNHGERFDRLTVFNPFEGDLAEVGL